MMCKSNRNGGVTKMSFSSTLVKWREQEVVNLRKFITYSLLGSVVLHIGILTFSVSNNIKNKVPDISRKPIEVTIIEAPLANQKKTPNFKVGKRGGEKSGGGGGKLSISFLGKSNNNSTNNSTNRKTYNSASSIIQQSILYKFSQSNPD
jgi:hypothetical protein